MRKQSLQGFRELDYFLSMWLKFEYSASSVNNPISTNDSVFYNDPEKLPRSFHVSPSRSFCRLLPTCFHCIIATLIIEGALCKTCISLKPRIQIFQVSWLDTDQASTSCSQFFQLMYLKSKKKSNLNVKCMCFTRLSAMIREVIPNDRLI